MKSIWNSALNILARRDHSQHELKAKLLKKYPEDEVQILEVLERLVDSGLQSDERFCEMWFRYQVNKGRGPNRIRMEARQKGVAEVVGQMIDSDQVDWFEQCSNCLQRKFGKGLAWEDRAKAYRFLAYRGFASEAINHAIEENLQAN